MCETDFGDNPPAAKELRYLDLVGVDRRKKTYFRLQ